MRVFQPQCTLPEEGPAFIQQPNVRSTMDIVWSSLSIIFLCTWSITHLNVPPQLRPLPPAKSFWEECRRGFFEAWYLFRKRTMWMLFNIMIPEYFLGKALVEFLGARELTKKMAEFQSGEKHDDEITWTATHTHLANMGGVFVQFEQDPAEPSVLDGDDKWRKFIKRLIDRCESGYPKLGPFDWKVHAGHYQMAKRWLSSHDNDDYTLDHRAARALAGDVWVLSASQLLEARKFGIVKKLPNISQAQIGDKNKGDGVVKFLAVLQVLWLTVQLLIRTSIGLQSSQLEITALAFAVCAFVTYLLLYSRPKDVQTPAIVRAQRDASYEEFATLVKLSHPVDGFGTTQVAYTMPTTAMPYAPHSSGKYRNIQTYGVFGGLIVFGAIHLIAWNLEFPNETERWAWRISALLVTVVPLLVAPLNADRVDEKWAAKSRTNSVIYTFYVIVAAIMVYLVFPAARLYLLVEAFRSTYYLTPSTYAATWASNIPHFG